MTKFKGKVLLCPLFFGDILAGEELNSGLPASPSFLFTLQAPKKAKRRQGGGDGGSSNVFSMFEQSQIQEYKEVSFITPSAGTRGAPASPQTEPQSPLPAATGQFWSETERLLGPFSERLLFFRPPVFVS